MTGLHQEDLPLFPLGTVLFPGMLLPLHIFEDRYRRLMEARRGSDPVFGVVLTREGREVADEPEIHAIGTAARLVGAGRYPDGRYDIVVQGDRRFRVEAGNWGAGYLTATVTWIDEPMGELDSAVGRDGLRRAAVTAFERFLAAFERTNGVDLPRAELSDDPLTASYTLCSLVPIDTWERQQLLEAPTVSDRLGRLVTILRRERDLLLTTGAGGATVNHPGTRFSPN